MCETDSCKTKTIEKCEVQENGIIRNHDGWIIGRLVDKVKFDSEHLNNQHPNKVLETNIEAFIDDLIEGNLFSGSQQNRIILEFAVKHNLPLTEKQCEMGHYNSPSNPYDPTAASRLRK